MLLKITFSFKISDSLEMVSKAYEEICLNVKVK